MSENNAWIRDVAEKYYQDGWFDQSRFRKAAFTLGDHDHCCIDFRKLSQIDYPESEKQGYYSSVDGIWFCTTCFNEYAKYRKLPLERNTIREIEAALEKHQAVVISLDNEQYFIKNAGSITVEHNGTAKEYESISDMENRQLFYGKLLCENIDFIFVGYSDPA